MSETFAGGHAAPRPSMESGRDSCAARLVAALPSAKGPGVLVLMNDEIQGACVLMADRGSVSRSG